MIDAAFNAVSDAVVVERLVKRFPSYVPGRAPRTVVNGLDLRVPVGGVTGLLGPNGAGKSTAVQILLGLARPTAGCAAVLGRDTWRESLAVRRDIAYVPAERALFDWMRAGDFIALVARQSTEWDETHARRLVRRWEIDERAPMRQLSTGMRSRLFLLVALARRARLLVLDEPTTGLDPAALDDALAELVGAAADGTTILLVTHRLDEVERICDRVTFMEQGRAVLQADLDEMRASWRVIDVVGHANPALMRQWEEVVSVTERGEDGEHASLLVRSSPEAVMERVRLVGATVTGVRALTLREIYLATMKRGAIDDNDNELEHAAHVDLA